MTFEKYFIHIYQNLYWVFCLLNTMKLTSKSKSAKLTVIINQRWTFRKNYTSFVICLADVRC